MWSIAIEILVVQALVGIVSIFAWTLFPQWLKRVLTRHPTGAGAVMWALCFLGVLSISGLIKALVIATTTVALSTLWLKLRRNKYAPKKKKSTPNRFPFSESKT